jgi:hypothetical protein
VVAGIPAVSGIPAVTGVLALADIALNAEVYAFAGITLLRRSRHAITKNQSYRLPTVHLFAIGPSEYRIETQSVALSDMGLIQ